MKMSKIFSLILVVVMLFSMTSCDTVIGFIKGFFGGDQPTPPTPSGLEGTYDVTLWVSEIAGVTELTAQQIDAFEAATPAS